MKTQSDARARLRIGGGLGRAAVERGLPRAGAATAPRPDRRRAPGSRRQRFEPVDYTARNPESPVGLLAGGLAIFVNGGVRSLTTSRWVLAGSLAPRWICSFLT
jgi:hypothetical protein